MSSVPALILPSVKRRKSRFPLQGENGEKKDLKKRGKRTTTTTAPRLARAQVFRFFFFFLSDASFRKNCNFSSMFVIARSSFPTRLLFLLGGMCIQVHFQGENGDSPDKRCQLILSVHFFFRPRIQELANSTISISPLSLRRKYACIIELVCIFFLGSKILRSRKWQAGALVSYFPCGFSFFFLPLAPFYIRT